MKMNRRGETGFMGSILAVMVVSVALTAFLGILSYTDLSLQERTFEPDLRFADRLELSEGEITGDYSEEMLRFIERCDLNGVRLKVSVAGPLSDASIDETFGTPSGSNAESRKGTTSISSDDGRTYAASFEVIYWWD